MLTRFAANSSRVHLRRVNEEFARQVPAGAVVLDAAAGAQPYRDLFGHACYESADFEMVKKEYAQTTYVCDLRSIPVEDGRFDFIIFNQALEHMPEPGAVLAELNRVMKPGGRMITTAPFFYEEHEQPYDFYRYTQYGHRHLFSQAGFAVERLEWLEGYTGALAYQLHRAALHLPRRLLFQPVRLLFALLAIWFYRLDVSRPLRNVGYPKNYVVIAVKPG
ncbi:MAG TPA: class I SAM-dependent methyltransferase [Allosphingosinicella sp.]|nr:class I SAM-dependent methyltransferase [Allosphingosinicella sp.]